MLKRTWVGSDFHCTHENLIPYYPSRSDFKTGSEMGEAIVFRWNKIVAPEDDVYVIGDFNLGPVPVSVEIASLLNGNKFLVPGNHDRKVVKDYQFKRYFTILDQIHEYREGGLHIIMCHYPIWEWNQMHRGSWHLHGHLHGKPHGIPGKIMDVSVDSNELTLYPMEYIAEYMADRPIRSH